MATDTDILDDDDTTEATATVNLDAVRSTYTRDELKRMKFTLIIDQNAKPMATARWRVTLDGQELGMGFSPYRCPYFGQLVRELLHGVECEETQYLNPWDWTHGEREFQFED